MNHQDAMAILDLVLQEHRELLATWHPEHPSRAPVETIVRAVAFAVDVITASKSRPTSYSGTIGLLRRERDKRYDMIKKWNVPFGPMVDSMFRGANDLELTAALLLGVSFRADRSPSSHRP